MSLHNIDCMEFMKTMDDDCIDLTLTDIPYNEVNEVQEQIRVGKALRKLNKGKADILTFDLIKFCNELNRITKGSIIIFCGNEQVSKIYGYFRNEQLKGNGTPRILVYHKTNPSPMNGKYLYLSACEFAVYFRKHKATFNAKCKHNIFEFPTGSSELHPTEKNHELIKELILDNSNEHDIIFDPCMGSGSILYVAKRLNRVIVGCELNKEYFEVAKKRIEFSENGLYLMPSKLKRDRIKLKKLF